MCLIRKTITSGTGLAFYLNIPILNTCRQQSFHGGIATIEGSSICYFIARRKRMIVQKL
jgi:hypothetical protein